MKVIYIRDSKSKGYLRIGVGEGEEKKEYTVSESDYRMCGSLLVGDEVSDEEGLRLSDMRYRAKQSALRILAYGDNNESSLLRKLISKSIDANVAKEVVREMVSRGYINERRQLERLVQIEANTSLSGKRKIVCKLVAKGYKKGEICEVISDLISHGIVDFEKSKQKLLEKRLPEGASPEQVRVLLYRYGY